jgi:hypothetical protein
VPLSLPLPAYLSLTRCFTLLRPDYIVTATQPNDTLFILLRLVHIVPATADIFDISTACLFIGRR